MTTARVAGLQQYGLPPGRRESVVPKTVCDQAKAGGSFAINAASGALNQPVRAMRSRCEVNYFVVKQCGEKTPPACLLG